MKIDNKYVVSALKVGHIIVLFTILSLVPTSSVWFIGSMQRIIF